MESAADTVPTNSGLFSRLWNLLPTLSNPLPNPGKYEDYNHEARDLFRMDGFQGFKFELNKGLSPYFSVNHHITLGSAHAPQGTYEFGSNYMTSNTFFFSRIDTSGTLQGKVQHQLTPQATVLGEALVSSTPHQSQAAVDVTYRGSDWTGFMKLGTHETYQVNYMQSLTPRLSVGLSSEYFGRIFGVPQPVSIMQGALRYNANNWVATAQLASYGGLGLSYTHRVKENVKLSTEIQFGAGNGHRKAIAFVGMEYMLRVGTFRSFINSEGQGLAMLERKLDPEVSMLLSGELDPKRAEYKFGIGLVIGGQ